MITIERTVDISKPVQTETLRGNEFKLEANAHTFRITVTSEGEPVALTGTVSASMLLADGSGLTLGGSLDEGVAVLTLPQAAYGVPGRFMLAIYSVQTGATEAETVKTCIYACVGAVINTYGEQQYDPGNLIPDAATLAGYIEDCLDATNDANDAAARAETAALTAVTYAEQTGKTDAQKTQARTNIGAASDEELSSLKSANLLNLDEIPDTVQSITFDGSGNVQSITHKKRTDQSVTVRTDAFTFTGNLITEVRTLNTGESLTIVTDTDTLVTTVTYAAA